MISPKQFGQSIRHAVRGVVLVFKSEQNFRIQSVIGIAVIVLGLFFGISANQFIVVLLLVMAVLALEMINSIFERIVDTFKPRIHPAVRDIKDIMAAAVLVSSIASAVIGITIFWPHVVGLF